MKCFKKRRVTISPNVATASTSTSASSHANVAPPEDLLTFVDGPYSLWHVLVVSIFAFIIFYNALNVFALELFLPQRIRFNCTDVGGGPNTCHIQNGSLCRNFEFSRTHGHTLIEKWNLVCDNAKKTMHLHIIYRTGIVFGGLLLGYISDVWGRKRMLFLSLILQTVTGTILYLSTNLTFYMVGMFFNGFALLGSTLTALVLTCEISSNTWRSFDLGLIGLAIGLGHVLIPFIWMIFKDYKHNLLVLSIPQICLIVLVGVVQESPAWLLSKNMTSKAESVLMTIACFGGNRAQSNFKIRPVHITNASSSRNSWLFNLVLQPRKSRWNIIALFLLWFLTPFLCHLVLAQIWFQSENIFKTMPLTGTACIISGILSMVFIHVFYHRLAIMASVALACLLFCGPYIVKKTTKIDRTEVFIYNFLGYMFFSIGILTLLNMTLRLFPTEMRCRGTGVTIAIAQISVIFALVIKSHVYSSLTILLVTFTVCSLSILLSTIVVFSVHGRELPDMLEDTRNFKHSYKPTRWSKLQTVSPTLDETEVNVVDFEGGSITTQRTVKPSRFSAFRKKVSRK